MAEMVGKYYLLNGKVLETVKDDVSFKRSSIYEVMKVLRGKPLFLKDHLNRFKISLEMAGFKDLVDIEIIKKQVWELIEINDISGVNVRIVITPDKDGYDLMMYLLKTAVPPELSSDLGVLARTYKGRRKDPNIKSTAESYKDLLEKQEYQGVFELLFVDEKNEILEGSKTNVFFVKKDGIYTAPAGSVLPGITRKQIFSICMEESIKITEKYISLKELEEVEAVFLTGTSIGVLPVSKIDDTNFDLNDKTVSMLAEKYEERASRDIERAEMPK